MGILPDRSRNSDAGFVRVFLRLHHILCIIKQSYMRIWAQDLRVGVLIAAGQPAMLLVEGARCAVAAYLERVTKAMHWGPTPARLVASAPVYKSTDKLFPIGLTNVADLYPSVVTANGTYNERDSIDYGALADSLNKSGHVDSARELDILRQHAFFHERGRTRTGYEPDELKLSKGGDLIVVYRAGDLVEVHSLKTAELNGIQGQVVRFQNDRI